MNLLFGERSTKPLDPRQLRDISEKIKKTLEGEPLEPDVVFNACDTVIKSLARPERMQQLNDAGITEKQQHSYLAQIGKQLNRQHLSERLSRELSQHTEMVPLGTLFHIAAGNAYGLPAFSVLEGLLTGNINLLKLPGPGDEVSLLILEWMIEAEPVLADYIYVFGFSSYDKQQLIALSQLADAVVVWGGDEAVKTVRELAAPNIRLIEWGHKISFAYADPNHMTAGEMEEIATHMCLTQQLYCNSCQGIYLDTDDFNCVKKFSAVFSERLETAYRQQMETVLPAGTRAQLTLKLRSREIEAIQYPERGVLYRNKNTSVWADKNKQLEVSYLFGNCWIKPLPREQLIRTLKPYKNYLQTAALYCADEKRKEYSSCLFRAGVNRVTTAKKLDRTDFNIPHDGEYALPKYCRLTVSD
ncbi:MAG: acyl-CoA reductase [Lachnospiraceae bacterium]